MARSKGFGRTKTIGVVVLYVVAIAIVAIARFLGVETREDAEEFAQIVLVPLGIAVLIGAALMLHRRSKSKLNPERTPYKDRK